MIRCHERVPGRGDELPSEFLVWPRQHRGRTGGVGASEAPKLPAGKEKTSSNRKNQGINLNGAPNYQFIILITPASDILT